MSICEPRAVAVLECGNTPGDPFYKLNRGLAANSARRGGGRVKVANRMKLEIPSRSDNEAFARVVVAAFASRLGPTLDEISYQDGGIEAVTHIIHAYEDRVG